MNCQSCGEEMALEEACPDCGNCGNCCDCSSGASLDDMGDSDENG
ncbi:MAG: hypothetical protein WC862_03295 [Patescibacteria group bacterium]